MIDPIPPREPNRIVRWIAISAICVAAFVAGFLVREPVRRLTQGSNAAAAADQHAKQLWTCGMHPQVIQDHPGDCPICHMELTPLKTDAAASSSSSSSSSSSAAAAPAERKVKYWWDPMMNPPYIAQQPGKSPMGMDLVPVYEDEVIAGPAVTIDPVIVQNMGVRVAPVVFGSVQREVRVVGYLEEPEPLHRDINLRVRGWIEKLYADTDGMPIQKGQKLFDLYSPDIQVAVNELLTARKSLAAASDPQAKQTAEVLYQASARKLR